MARRWWERRYALYRLPPNPVRELLTSTFHNQEHYYHARSDMVTPYRHRRSKSLHSARRAVVLALALFAAVLLAGCPGPTPPPSSISTGGATISSVVDAIVTNEMQRTGVPGISVAIARGENVIYEQGYGRANAALGLPVNVNTVFEIGSVTKQFTAALVLQLVASGAIALDAPAITYLPGSGLSPNISVRMLLNQASGLPDYTTFPQYQSWETFGAPESTVIGDIASAGLLFPPGSYFSYSNSNYFVLGAILEVVTGATYANLVQGNIATHLGLPSLEYNVPSGSLAAIGYMVGATRPIDRSIAFAAGALSSDAHDLVMWLNDLRTGAVIPPALFDAMVVAPPIPSAGNGASNYGFGLFLGTLMGHPTAYHEGGIPGFDAFDLMFLDDGFSIAVLTNADPYDPTALADEIVRGVCSQFASQC